MTLKIKYISIQFGISLPKIIFFSLQYFSFLVGHATKSLSVWVVGCEKVVFAKKKKYYERKKNIKKSRLLVNYHV